MKKLPILVALLGFAPFGSNPLTAAEGARTAAECQPLTSSNMEACCGDKEWREIILPDEVRFCPPLSADDTDSGRIGLGVAAIDDQGTNPSEGPDTTDTTDIAGNPGNTKDVGGAGEKGMDIESPPTGDKGVSN